MSEPLFRWCCRTCGWAKTASKPIHPYCEHANIVKEQLVEQWVEVQELSEPAIVTEMAKAISIVDDWLPGVWNDIPEESQEGYLDEAKAALRVVVLSLRMRLSRGDIANTLDMTTEQLDALMAGDE